MNWLEHLRVHISIQQAGGGRGAKSYGHRYKDVRHFVVSILLCFGGRGPQVEKELQPPPSCTPTRCRHTILFYIHTTRVDGGSLHLPKSGTPAQVLSGTPFYRIDGYESLYVFDSGNEPPFVQLELYKVREYQNWEDLLLETSSFTPGGAQ